MCTADMVLKIAAAVGVNILLSLSFGCGSGVHAYSCVFGILGTSVTQVCEQCKPFNNVSMFTMLEHTQCLLSVLYRQFTLQYLYTKLILLFIILQLGQYLSLVWLLTNILTQFSKVRSFNWLNPETENHTYWGIIKFPLFSRSNCCQGCEICFPLPNLFLLCLLHLVNSNNGTIKHLWYWFWTVLTFCAFQSFLTLSLKKGEDNF